jgi:hypothetical protein
MSETLTELRRTILAAEELTRAINRYARAVERQAKAMERREMRHSWPLAYGRGPGPDLFSDRETVH